MNEEDYIPAREAARLEKAINRSKRKSKRLEKRRTGSRPTIWGIVAAFGYFIIRAAVTLSLGFFILAMVLSVILYVHEGLAFSPDREFFNNDTLSNTYTGPITFEVDTIQFNRQMP